MKKKHLFLSIFFVINHALLYAQVDVEKIDKLIEEISENSDEELDFSQLYEDLYYYAQNPLNLNTATREDMEKIQFLSDFNIEDILAYQRSAGEMQSIYELQLLESFSDNDIKNLLPFVCIEPIKQKSMPHFKDIVKYGRNNVFLRTQFFTQKQKGYSEEVDIDKRYRGNRFKYYARYQFQYKQKIKFGFTAEKDPGEAFFKEQQKQGFDFYSGHLELRNIGILNKLTVGDYQVNFGQGLIAWSGFSAGGKSSYVMSLRKKYPGLRKYSSSDENNFMRGIGTSLKFGEFSLTGFVSYKFIDGNLNIKDTLSDVEQSITSFQVTGLHRNLGELADKHAVSEFVYGGNARWRHKSFKLGASYIQYFFGKELAKKVKPYNQFDFQGNSGLNASVDYQFSYKNLYFFGEEAISHTGGYALLNSALMKLAPQYSLGILQRYYTKDYQAYYANAFGEQSKTTNERGVYFGTELHPIRKLTVSAYFDAFRFPWMKFRSYAPTSGFDFFTELNYSISRHANMYIRYKQENKYENAQNDLTQVIPVVPKAKRQVRFHINYSPAPNLVLKNRVEFAQFTKLNKENENGWLVYQDINYKFSTFPLKINARIAFFDAPYNARMYAYENDVLYAFSIPAYIGQGIRTYFTLKYTLIEGFLDVWLRYANFSYADRTTIGSNYDEIQGNNKSEIKLQIRIKF